MNYTNLPPGRSRGIAYFNYIRNRRMNNILRSSRIITNLRPIEQRIIMYSPIVRRNNFYTYENLSQLQDVKIGLINKNLILNSKVKIWNNLNKETCVICQDDIINNEIIRNLKCNHNFHIDCIDTWFSENKKCPMCKFEL